VFAPRGTTGGRVAVEPIDAKRWILTEPLRYVGERDEFIVPEGYVTDFASVPRLVVWLVPSYGLYTKAAILHDWLITDALPTGRITSNDVDGLFRRALRELGVPPVKRWLMWTAVRWGAAFSRRRSAGWWRSAPGVIAISIPAAAAFVLPVAAVGVGLTVYGVAEAIATMGRKQGPSTGTIST
jgi:hypothetical protein